MIAVLPTPPLLDRPTSPEAKTLLQSSSFGGAVAFSAIRDRSRSRRGRSDPARNVLLTERWAASRSLVLPRCHCRGGARHPVVGEVTEAADLSAPGRTRTCDTRFRKPLLYPLSYRGGEQLGKQIRRNRCVHREYPFGKPLLYPLSYRGRVTMVTPSRRRSDATLELRLRSRGPRGVRQRLEAGRSKVYSRGEVEKPQVSSRGAV
jgi:hypothetical protein